MGAHHVQKPPRAPFNPFDSILVKLLGVLAVTFLGGIGFWVMVFKALSALDAL